MFSHEIMNDQWLNDLPYLGNIQHSRKVISRSYGTISHLPGSKMIDQRDTELGESEVLLLTFARASFRDRVIITEKVDGMNTGVLRLNDRLYPVTRKGYDVRINPNNWARIFALFVSNNGRRFLNVLCNGERLCGEWMIKTHTVDYILNTEPYIVYDIIQADGSRLTYDEFMQRIKLEKFTPAGLIHMGESMEPEMALSLMGNGYHGAVDQPEGVVYKYESFNSGFVCSGKFVSHPNVGKDEFFRADKYVFNKMKKKYSIYIPEIQEGGI